MNPIQTMLAVAAIGGRLGIDGENLRTILPRDCPAELKASIRQHKQELIALLRLNFLIVQSAVIDELLLWVPDQATKDALLNAGADAASIYTPDDLNTLVNHRVTAGDIAIIHEARRALNGRISP